VILETERDRIIEQRVMTRLLTCFTAEVRAVRLPRMSACDFLIEQNETITMGLEIKSRKETDDKIRSYGGLMLKHRKLAEMQQVAEILQIRVAVIFAFGDGEGTIYACDPVKVTDVQPTVPPPRRNFRGLACDEEPVVYLDWNKHLMRVA
jgi:hypothetical protein